MQKLNPDLHSEKQEAIEYDDLLFRIVICIPIALFIVFFSFEIVDFRTAIYSFYFWLDLTVAYIASLLIFWILNTITRLLDKNYGWRNRTVERIMLQISFGILMNIFVAFIISMGYYAFLGKHILDTMYVTVELPITVLFIVFANVYYLLYFVWNRLTHTEDLNKVFLQTINTFQENMLKTPSVKSRETARQEDAPKYMFMAKTIDRIRYIPFEEIACFLKKDDHYLILTFKNETILILQTLKEVEEVMDQEQLFRLTRIVIANYKICREYRAYKTSGQIEVMTAAPLNKAIIISRDNAQRFLDWMNR